MSQKPGGRSHFLPQKLVQKDGGAREDGRRRPLDAAPPPPSPGILSHPAEGLNPPLLINPPVTPSIHGMLPPAGGRGRGGANLTALRSWRETGGTGGRTGGREGQGGTGGDGRLLPLLHNLLPISGVIQRVFPTIISKSGGSGANPAALRRAGGLRSDNSKGSGSCKGLLSRVPISSRSAA